MYGLFQDVRFAARLLGRAPGFTLMVVLTLALGIGANTAIFSVVYAVLLRPLPYPESERLVMVWQDLRARGGPADEGVTSGNYADWRRETAIFRELAVVTGWPASLISGDSPEALPGEQVSYEYFNLLGAAPALGRTFTDRDGQPNAPRVAVISDGLWRRGFGAQPSAVGRVVTLNGEPHEIVGVLPAGFRPVVNATAEIWRPLRIDLAAPSRGAIVLRAVARLAPGLDLEGARTAAGILARQLEVLHPGFNQKAGINLVLLHEDVVGDIRPGLLALLGAVGCVLLIACANIANLMLARGSARGRELAVRLALGAARRRVVRQLLTESLLLSTLSGAAGLLVGAWALEALVRIAPASAPRLDEIALDGPALLFTAMLALATGILFGIAPALQSARADVTHGLKDGARGSTAGAGRKTRRALIALEVALALVLLTGGGLLLQTFTRLQSADLGFTPDNVLVGFVNPPRTTYRTPAQRAALYDQLLEKASALPGVRSAALASVLPLSGDSDMDFLIDGRAAPQSQSEGLVTWYRLVSAGYFDAMGMHIRSGRAFAAGDATPSVLVNEAFVRRHFPGEDPLGRRLRFASDAPWFTIIGIVADARARGAREAARVETFIPYWQMPEPGINVILKGDANAPALAVPLKQAVAALDRNLPVSNVEPLSDIVRESIGQPRFLALLVAAFAGLALALAAIGIYGVMAYAVLQRTTEIGVRMALGATRRDVFRLVVGDGLRLTGVGLLLGVACSVPVARSMTALLFGVGPGDPATLAATAGLLLAVALIACAIPARRATRVDPMVALRGD